MSPEVTLFFKIFNAIGIFCGVLFAYFRMKDTYQNNNKRKETQAFYEKAWNAIDRSGLSRLPFKTIQWIVAEKTRLTGIVVRYSMTVFNLFFLNRESERSGNDERPARVLGFLIMIVGLFGPLFSFVLVSNIILKIIVFVIYLFFIKAFVKYIKTTKFLENLNLYILVSLLLLISYLLIIYSISLMPIRNATVFSFIIIIPTSFLLFLAGSFHSQIVRRFFGEEDYSLFNDFITNLSISIPVSFFITMAALLLGQSFLPALRFGGVYPLLFSNLFFDGLTLVFTFFILKWSIKDKQVYRIPIAIILDVFIAAIFAVLSIWIGLLFFENQITIPEAINILLAKSSDGSEWELGPLFWVSHTTFIPTLIYLSLIVIAIIGKYFSLPVLWFFKGVSGSERPHYATATTFGFIAALCVGIAQLIRLWAT